jgi:hypothetical protein
MRKHLVYLAVAALGAATLGACGGDDDTAATASEAIEANDGQSTDSTERENADDVTDATTGNREYDALLEKARTASYRVTYQSDDGDDEFTISHDPPKSAFITDDGTMYIRSGDESITCSGQGGELQCFTMPDAGAGADAVVQAFFGVYAGLLATSEEADGVLFDVTTSSDEQVAGRAAKCAEVEAGALTGGDGRFKVCIDAETGVLLLGETESDGTTNQIEAVKVGEPIASDFEPPVEPTDLGSVGDMPTQP